MQYTKITYLEKIIHEMSSLIQAVYLCSELMIENQDICNKENLSHIHEASEKLRKLLSLLTSITHLKTSEIDLHLEEVDLIALVQHEIKYHQVRNKSNPDLKIDCVSNVRNCPVKVDQFWFKQLLANLIINAINHCERGIIEVCTDIVTKTGKHYFFLSVRDEGCGIAEDELKIIFSPFERGTHSIGKIPGSGIGLAIVKEIVESHDGIVTARNNEKGGATFDVVIPLKR